MCWPSQAAEKAHVAEVVLVRVLYGQARMGRKISLQVPANTSCMGQSQHIGPYCCCPSGPTYSVSDSMEAKTDL